MDNNRTQMYRRMLLAGFLTSSIPFCAAMTAAQPTASPGGTEPADSTASHSAAPAAARLLSTTHTVGSARGALKYREIWGIDNLKIEPTASGSLIRFSYRVLDPEKAQVLNDKKKDPYLVLGATGRRLGVESAERLGQMRQVAAPESGREYWMMFGNPGHMVRPGDRVDIVIGTFHAYGLFVEPPQAAVARRQ
jgi:hypothetical protein